MLRLVSDRRACKCCKTGSSPADTGPWQYTFCDKRVLDPIENFVTKESEDHRNSYKSQVYRGPKPIACYQCYTRVNGL